MRSGDTPKTSTQTIVVFPAQTQYISSSWDASTPLSATFDATTTDHYYDLFLNNATKITVSAFTVAAGLDVGIQVYKDDASLAAVGPFVDQFGAGLRERGAYTSSGGFGNLIFRVNKYSGTGSYKVSRMDNSSSGLPLSGFSPSCTGGTGIFTNRCVEYLDGNPGSNAACVFLQGTGSTYSSSSCSSTNRIARCYSNPIVEDSRGIVSFYSPHDTTATANAACGSDILTTP